jgi:hypothetical protein
MHGECTPGGLQAADLRRNWWAILGSNQYPVTFCKVQEDLPRVPIGTVYVS